MDRQGALELYGAVIGRLSDNNRSTEDSVVIALDPGVDLALRLYVDGTEIVGAGLGPLPINVRLDTAAFRADAYEATVVPDELVPALSLLREVAQQSGASFPEFAMARCERDGYILGFPPCTH